MSCVCGKPKNHCDPCASVALTTGRGTGRTRRMVEALTDETRTVVVDNPQLGLYVERMMRDLRPDLYRNPATAPRVVVVRTTRDCDRLRGCLFEVDHAVWDCETLTGEARDLLAILYKTQRRPASRGTANATIERDGEGNTTAVVLPGKGWS